MKENPEQFESRKIDHVRIALDPRVQAKEARDLDRVSLIHEALPEIDFQDVSLSTKIKDHHLSTPLFISSMTAGHSQAIEINACLAQAAQARGWMMGVGSQRKELFDPRAAIEWARIRERAPKALVFGNLGLSQLIHTPVEKIQELMENLGASGVFIHTNPLQEVLQKEGTPQFRGGLEALGRLSQALSIPVVLKEVGCGFSAATLERLSDRGLYAVDVSGLGGTHWGRIETHRLTGSAQEVGALFSNWGISTVDSVLSARSSARISYQIWASGGVRSGVDAAKLLAMGSQMVGIANPFLQAAIQEVETGRPVVTDLMERFERELKISLFCTGCENVDQLRKKGVWKYV